MSLIGLVKSDVGPLAGGRQGTPTDVPNKTACNGGEEITPEGIGVW